MSGNNKVICTRYAPSPTGQLHIGGARTALFNYLYAKKNNGKFILRIEDTDSDRNIANGHIAVENDLKVLRIFPDESFSIPGSCGPYLQSQKLDRYSEVCEKLLKEGKAYRCFCSEQELHEEKQAAIRNNTAPFYSKKCRWLTESEIQDRLSRKQPYTVRMKMDLMKNYVWDDLIRGQINIPCTSQTDHIIFRPSGVPTYNLAVVVDDYDMSITHVLRGEEHISNTPCQLAIYNALGWQSKIPKIGHLSIIVDEDRKKLSKRSGQEYNFISGLIDKGYPPEAIFNFLALLGWSYGEQEIFDQQEIIKLFSLENLSSAPAFFDIEKLNWISHRYFQDMSHEYYWNFIKDRFTVDLGENNEKKKLFAFVYKNNISHASELNTLAENFFRKRQLNEKHKEFLKNHLTLLKLAKEYFPSTHLISTGEEVKWDQIVIRNYLKQLLSISGVKGANFYKPLRVAFSYEEEGFELVNVLHCLGRDTLLSNLESAINQVENS